MQAEQLKDDARAEAQPAFTIGTAVGGIDAERGGLMKIGAATGMTSLTYLGRTLVEAAVFAKVMAQAGVGGKGATPQDILARIMFGLELDLQPMTAIRELFIINGLCGMRSRLMHTLARRAGARIHFVEATDKRCELMIVPPGETREHAYVWTIDRAVKAQLLRNDTWTKYPEDMLRSRAISEAVNYSCPEVLAGGMYSVEELQDMTVTGERPAEGMKEATNAKMAEFNKVFSGEAAAVDPFKAPRTTRTRTQDDAPAPTGAIDTTETTDEAATEDKTDMGTMTAREKKVAEGVAKQDAARAAAKEAKARRVKREEPKPTKLDDGQAAMAIAMTKAAESKSLVFIDGRIDMQSCEGSAVGLDQIAYWPRDLAAMVNAKEIYDAIVAAPVWVDPAEQGA